MATSGLPRLVWRSLETMSSTYGFLAVRESIASPLPKQVFVAGCPQRVARQGVAMGWNAQFRHPMFTLSVYFHERHENKPL